MKLAKNLMRSACLVLGALTVSSPASTAGATATVLVGNGGLVFTPATTQIALHDSVVWDWRGAFHSTTSGTTSGASAMPDGLWDSGVVASASHTFTNTFNSSGTFPYYCSLHYASGMKGTIIVSAPNSPPTVTITNPIAGSTLSAPASLALTAVAADTDGTITNVQFLQGAASLGNITAAPFLVGLNDLPAADYTFSAIASDDGGLTATNSVVIHVVTAIPVTLSNPVFSPPNYFQFSYSANAGLAYVVEVSSNLMDWHSLTTNTATINPAEFMDTNAGSGGAFYRVGRKPNP